MDGFLSFPGKSSHSQWASSRGPNQLVEVTHGVENADIAVGVGRLLGFSSTSQQLRAAVEANTEKLLKAGQIYIEGDFVKASDAV